MKVIDKYISGILQVYIEEVRVIIVYLIIVYCYIRVLFTSTLFMGKGERIKKDKIVMYELLISIII